MELLTFGVLNSTQQQGDLQKSLFSVCEWVQILPSDRKKELDQMEDVGVIETYLSVYGWTLKTLILPLKENTTLCQS